MHVQIAVVQNATGIVPSGGKTTTRFEHSALTRDNRYKRLKNHLRPIALMPVRFIGRWVRLAVIYTGRSNKGVRRNLSSDRGKGGEAVHFLVRRLYRYCSTRQTIKNTTNIEIKI